MGSAQNVDIPFSRKSFQHLPLKDLYNKIKNPGDNPELIQF